ncbi:MAG: hypothetical protein QNI99_06425 [Woeseiaceae bacterium]|nr:hypothetical protein [Woeseiaceae bacterium]
MFRSILIAAFALLPATVCAGPDRSPLYELVEAERWAEVVAHLSERLEDNPWYGEDWYLLGLAHSRLGDCERAAPLYARALELGNNGSTWGMRDARVEAAECAALLGDADAAVEHLSIAQARHKFDDFARFADDSRFGSLSEHPEFRRMSGAGDVSGVDRVAGWRSDLDYFVGLMLRRHPNPFHTVDEDEWRAAAGALRAEIPELTDLQIVGRFMHLAGMIEDGHTSVYPPFEGPLAFHMSPIWAYAFEDEWRIVAAAPDHEELVGARIVAVEGVPMADAETLIAGHLPRDNDFTPKWITSVALQFVEISAGVFGAEDPSLLTLDVELSSGERLSVSLPGGPMDRNPMAAWVPSDWPSVEPENAPLWLNRVDDGLWFEELPEIGAIYAQINQIRDGDERSLEDFGRELRQRLTDGEYRHLIIDLRHNNGGNGYLNWPFVRELVRTEAIDHADGLFVIAGRRTFSAAQLLANMLEFHTDAIFVGEPTGSSPAFYGEDTLFRLPYSGLMGSISSFWFQNRFISDDKRPWIAPDLAAELSFDDLKSGRDPALEAIREYLGRQR